MSYCVCSSSVTRVYCDKTTDAWITLFWQTDIVGNDVGHINEVTPGTISTGTADRIGGSTPGAGNLSRSSQPPGSTQPGHLLVGRRNEYRPKTADALRLGIKAGMARVWWIAKLDLYSTEKWFISSTFGW